MIIVTIGLASAGVVAVGEGVLDKGSSAEEGQGLIHTYLHLLGNDDDYRDTLNPLAKAAVLDSYRKLAGKDYTKLRKIAKNLAEQVTKFQAASPGALGLDGFQKWLQAQQVPRKSADQLSKDLHEVRSFFLRLARIGLTKKEVMTYKDSICDQLREFLPGVEVMDIISLVEDAAKLTAKAPRAAVTAPPQTKAPGAPMNPAQPGTKDQPLFIPDIPAPGTAPLFPGQELQRPPMQRMYTVGKFVISYGAPFREMNPKLPDEKELSESVVTLLASKERKLFHLAKVPDTRATKQDGAHHGTMIAEQNERARKRDVDEALHPPPSPDSAVPPIARPDAPEGNPVEMKVSDFGEPRVISATALLDVYDAIVKKLTDRGLIGIYILADINPRRGVDEREPGVKDVKVTVFISEVVKIRTIAWKVPFKPGDLPKINDDEAPDGQSMKDPKHLGIRNNSPIIAGQAIEKQLLQDYLIKLNRQRGLHVEAEIKPTGEPGKVMLDYLIKE